METTIHCIYNVYSTLNLTHFLFIVSGQKRKKHVANGHSCLSIDGMDEREC